MNLAYLQLTPDDILNAVEAQGYVTDGRILALNSYENRVYQVGLEEDSPLVAKFYRPQRWSNAAIVEEHSFSRELADNEIPVVAPLVSSAGESLFDTGVFRFALFPRRGGRAAELDNAQQLTQIGRFLGRLHTVGAATSFRHRSRLSMENMIIEPSRSLLENRWLPVELEVAYESLIDQLVEQIEGCYARAGQLPEIRLHGDFHLGNILWRDDAPIIVDLDDCRTGPAVQDIWLLLSGDRPYMAARLQNVMEGYLDFCDFNPRELHLVEALRTMRMVHYASWLAKRWQDPAFPRAFPWFDSPRYWDEHILSLREQAALMQEPPLPLAD